LFFYNTGLILPNQFFLKNILDNAMREGLLLQNIKNAFSDAGKA
jgi:hypothetical protein